MKNTNNGGTRLIALVFLALTGCAAPAPEGPISAEAGIPGQTSSPTTAAPLGERLSSAIRSAGPDISDTVKVTSTDGIVLLTGQVLSEEAKSQATNTAVFIGGSELRRLTNELRVVDAIDTSGAEQDRRLAASVTSILADNLPQPAQRLEVVAETGRVYLVGHISREQGDAVTELVGGLEGVDAITTVFTYAD